MKKSTSQATETVKIDMESVVKINAPDGKNSVLFNKKFFLFLMSYIATASVGAIAGYYGRGNQPTTVPQKNAIDIDTVIRNLEELRESNQGAYSHWDTTTQSNVPEALCYLGSSGLNIEYAKTMTWTGVTTNEFENIKGIISIDFKTLAEAYEKYLKEYGHTKSANYEDTREYYANRHTYALKDVDTVTPTQRPAKTLTPGTVTGKTKKPTQQQTQSTTVFPSRHPTPQANTTWPSTAPAWKNSTAPTLNPTRNSTAPTMNPLESTTAKPSSKKPTKKPTNITNKPSSKQPSATPSSKPSARRR